MPRITDDLFRSKFIESHADLDREIPGASQKLHEALDNYLEKEIKEPPLPEKSKEELARDALIKLAGTRRLTGPERRKLANLNRRLKAKERQQLRRRRSR